jgi:hypothetical protein
MCCNADILFSVLVLHWVTSKDSANNSSARNSKSAGHPAANRLERFGFSNQCQPKVTTLISTVREMKGEAEDNEMGIEEWHNGAENSSYPIDGILVQSAQVVEIEGGSEGSLEIVNELKRGGSHNTTDDLVEKPVKCVTRNQY